MKTPLSVRLSSFLAPSLLGAAMLIGMAAPVRAGLSVDLNLAKFTANGTNYYYTITASLNTNFTLPNPPYGEYFVTSPNYPNAPYSSGNFHYDSTNGFYEEGVGYNFYADYDSVMQAATNGHWTIFVTAPGSTNVTSYPFQVKAEGLSSNSLPAAVVTSPLDGTTNASPNAGFTFQGPTNFNHVTVQLQNGDGSYNISSNLAPNATSWRPPGPLSYGSYSFTPDYATNGTSYLVASTPTNGAGQAISSWSSTCELNSSYTVHFTVPSPFTPPVGGHVLVARYTWDGTNTDPLADSVDVTGNGSSMSFGGGAGAAGGVTLTTAAAEGNQAVQFHDGDGGSMGWLGVTLPAPVIQALQLSFSVSCWVKTTQTFGNDNDYAYNGAGIVAADVNGQNNDVIPMALTGSKIGFNTGGNADDTLNSQTRVNDGNYHHVVVTRDQWSGVKTIYIDGVLDAMDVGTTNDLDTPQKLTLGVLSDAGNPNPDDFNYYNGFDGTIDDLQVYAGVLNSAEVAYLYANPGSTAPSLPVNGLVAHYSFDDTNEIGADVSGNGYDLTYNGAPQGNGVAFNSTAEAGGSAAYFDGGSFLSYNTAPTNVLAALAGDLTVAVWVQTTQIWGNDGDPAYADAGIVAADVPGPANDIVPMALTGGGIGFNTGGSSDDTVSSTTDINDGTYHQIVITRTQATGEKKIYIDGVLNNSDAATTNLLNAPQILAIGAQIDASQSNPSQAGTGPYYQGLLDDLQIYSRVLGADEIASLYNNPGTTVTNEPMDFNAALGTTNLDWTTGGDADWFVETTNTLDGVSAAQSGSVVGDEESVLTVNVTGPATISFQWEVSPNANNLNEAFAVDGSTLDSTENAYWTADGPFNIGAGPHVLSWVVNANGDGDPTEAGYLAEVTLVTAGPPVITENPASQTNYPGYSAGLAAAARSVTPVNWQWYKAGSGLIAGATNAFYSPTNSGTAGVAGGYYAVASNGTGAATTLTATVTFVSAPPPPAWTRAFRSPFYPLTGTPFTDYNGGCVADATGNVYVANQYLGNILVENSASATIKTLTTGGADGAAALVKYLNTNSPVNTAPIAWIAGLTNDDPASFSYADCVALAPGNGAYLASILSGTNYLGTNRFANTGGFSVLLSRFDANGSNVWSRLIGTNSTVSLASYNCVAADAAGNLTVAGLMSGTVDFGGTNLTSASGLAGFLAQYNTNGTLRWVELLPEFPWGITEAGGQIYASLSVAVTGTATNLTAGSLTVPTDRAYGLAALNATNGAALWIRGLGEQYGMSSAHDYPLVAAAGADVFVTGTANGSTATFGSLTVNLAGGREQYFARYDTNGTAQAAIPFGSTTTMPWAAAASGSGVYVAGDFDGYAAFGNLYITAPATPTSYLGTNYYTQPFVAKFDRNGNPLWARNGVAPVLGNFRGVAPVADGVWASGFVDVTTDVSNNIVPALFGTNQVISDFLPEGSPESSLVFTRGGVVAKITETSAATAVVLLQPAEAGTNFAFQFVSEAGFTHTVQYSTNLAAGAGWQTYTNVAGDGTVKTLVLPLSTFKPAQQAFVRVSTQ